jgi:hypothetical protein
VEPGFIGQKPWTDADTANLSADGHRLCTAADALLDKLLAKDKGLQVKARDILEQGGDSVSRSRVPSSSRTRRKSGPRSTSSSSRTRRCKAPCATR